MDNTLEKTNTVFVEIMSKQKQLCQQDNINLNSDSEKIRFFEAHLKELQNWAESNSWNYAAYFLEKAQESLVCLDNFNRYEENIHGKNTKN